MQYTAVGFWGVHGEVDEWRTHALGPTGNIIMGVVHAPSGGARGKLIHIALLRMCCE